MYNTACLRSQAELCLRLAQHCSDQPMSRHLDVLAARYHEAALRTEFGMPPDNDARLRLPPSAGRPALR